LGAAQKRRPAPARQRKVPVSAAGDHHGQADRASLRPRRGGGLNGPYRLNTTTFFADGVVNTLTAGSGRNWFFLQKKDKANPTPTNQVTFI
jgi:hypothetical protein